MKWKQSDYSCIIYVGYWRWDRYMVRQEQTDRSTDNVFEYLSSAYGFLSRPFLHNTGTQFDRQVRHALASVCNPKKADSTTIQLLHLQSFKLISQGHQMCICKKRREIQSAIYFLFWIFLSFIYLFFVCFNTSSYIGMNTGTCKNTSDWSGGLWLIYLWVYRNILKSCSEEQNWVGFFIHGVPHRVYR